VLPERLRPWAEETSEALIADVGSTGSRIVGALDDLRPVFHARRGDETDDPSTLPGPVLLRSAGFGLLGLVELLVRSGAVPADHTDVAGQRPVTSEQH
jgi:hypothetical protein